MFWVRLNLLVPFLSWGTIPYDFVQICAVDEDNELVDEWTDGHNDPVVLSLSAYVQTKTQN